MIGYRKPILGTLACLALATGWAQDPTEVADHNLTEWKLGKVISGEEIKLADLKGKVVAIEKWGIN